MRDAFGVERVSKGLPSALRTGNALSPYARNLQRKNRLGQVAGRAVARAKQNPPTPKPFERPKQLTLLNRSGQKVTLNPASKKRRAS